MFERTSALGPVLADHVSDATGRTSPDGHLLIRIGEVRILGLIQIAAFRNTLPELERAVSSLLDGRLPATVGEATRIGTRILFKTGPEQFWVVTEEGDDLATALEAAVPPAIGAVTQLSHSRTRLFIEGPAATHVLTTAIALDLDHDVFRVGSFALTGIHHVPVLLHRSAADRYELYVPRTFALWIWGWLTDADRPFHQPAK